MFNHASATTNFRIERVMGGLSRSDADSYRTLFCGPDPADPNKILVRKIVQLNERTYAYEETRITRNPGKQPTAHTQMSKLADVNLKEDVSAQELQIRGQHRPIPNVLGFSLYYRKTNHGTNHLSIVENSLWKTSGSGWAEWWQTFQDRRDMSSYLRTRWIMN